jgi:hypothetical protein
LRHIGGRLKKLVYFIINRDNEKAPTRFHHEAKWLKTDAAHHDLPACKYMRRAPGHSETASSERFGGKPDK